MFATSALKAVFPLATGGRKGSSVLASFCMCSRPSPSLPLLLSGGGYAESQPADFHIKGRPPPAGPAGRARLGRTRPVPCAIAPREMKRQAAVNSEVERMLDPFPLRFLPPLFPPRVVPRRQSVASLPPSRHARPGRPNKMAQPCIPRAERASSLPRPDRNPPPPPNPPRSKYIIIVSSNPLAKTNLPATPFLFSRNLNSGTCTSRRSRAGAASSRRCSGGGSSPSSRPRPPWSGCACSSRASGRPTASCSSWC